MTDSPRYILSFDAALGPCSVAVMEGDQLLAQMEEPQKHQQARNLVPMVQECLKSSGIEPQQLSEIVTTIGPGTFTGLRIGLASAQAMAYALKCPLVGVTSLAATAMAAQMQDSCKDVGTVLIALNAGKGDAYCQPFTLQPKPCAIDEPVLIPQADITRLGKDYDISVGNVDMVQQVPLSAYHAALAASLPDFRQKAEPYYIRQPDAKLPAIE